MKKLKFNEKFSFELIFLSNSDAITKINELELEPNLENDEPPRFY
jgi:hypothetical protein